jgi:cobalt-zinc-cadmium resistance protein CzcA
MRNLIEGGLLVIAVLLLLLGSFRSGIVVSVAIPLSMLVALKCDCLGCSRTRS